MPQPPDPQSKTRTLRHPLGKKLGTRVKLPNASWVQKRLENFSYKSESTLLFSTTTITTIDSQLSLLLQLRRLLRRSVLFLLLLYHLICHYFAARRSYHNYPRQLSLFQASCDLEDSKLHQLSTLFRSLSNRISHFQVQGGIYWAFAKTAGAAR